MARCSMFVQHYHETTHSGITNLFTQRQEKRVGTVGRVSINEAVSLRPPCLNTADLPADDLVKLCAGSPHCNEIKVLNDRSMALAFS